MKFHNFSGRAVPGEIYESHVGRDFPPASTLANFSIGRAYA